MKSGPDPFDLVREWFAAYNRGELDAIDVFYEATASLEQDNGLVQGRDGIRGVLASHFAQWDPGFDGGIRRRVRMIGRIESGSIHAEWTEREIRDGAVRERRGYSDFVVDGGHIHTQREVAHDFPVDSDELAIPPNTPLPSRTYPHRPVVGVGAVIVHEGSVVLIKRKFEPLAGQWSLPGGTLELGESLEAGVAREMREETGLEVDVGPVVEVFDRILLDTEGRVRYHFVIVDYLCTSADGEPIAATDAEAVAWASAEELDQYQVNAHATAVIRKGLALTRA